jgi:glutaredoxin
MHALSVVAALAGGQGFFERSDLDFWGARRSAPGPAAELWSDSSAPLPVRRLLEAPTRENALAYLGWQEARLARLREAMTVVESLRRPEPPPPPDAGILYFSREGCPYCALQERELDGIPVVRVPEGSELWAKHGVTSVPTLVVNGRALRGLTARSRILAERGRD